MGIALLFPGQGSQTVGMGRAVAEACAASRETFEEVDDTLGKALSKLIWEGPIEELTLTENAQPALMATSIAVLKFLESELGEDMVWKEVKLVAGHSLGEYSALTAAGALSLSNAAKLLQLRGRSMQEAVKPGEGAMAAIIGLERDQILRLCEEVSNLGTCDLANDNGGGQIVLSGARAAVEAAMEKAKEAGAKRAVPLEVSAPFHSALMQPAAEVMRDALKETDINPPRAPVLANVTTELTEEADQIRKNLTDQVVGSVRWAESMGKLSELGVSQAIELGAGKVLAGLMRRIDKSIATSSIGVPDQIGGFPT